MRTIKNYAYNLSYQLIALIVPIVAAPYLTRVLGPEALGVFGYVNSLTILITTFVLLGIYQYGSRQTAYVRDDPEQLNVVFWRIMTAHLLLLGAGSVIYAAVVLATGRYPFYFLLYYSYLFGCCLDCTWLFVGMEEMKWVVLKNSLIKLLTLAGIFLFVRKPEDVGLYLVIQGGAVILANLAAYPQLRRYVKRPRLISDSLLDDLKASLILFLPTAAYTLYLQCDKIMIEWLTGAPEQVAYYEYAEKFVMIPMAVILALSTVMMPRIANEHRKNHRDTISDLLAKTARVSFIMAFPLMVGLIVLSGKLIPWYLGDDFRPSIRAVWILAPLVVTNSMMAVSGNQYFTATDQPKILLKAQLSAALLNLAVNALLIPRFGYLGAAIATVLSSVMCTLVQYRHFLEQIRMPGLFGYGLKYCALACAVGLAVYGLCRGMAPSPWTNLIQICLGMALYTAGCLVWKDQMTAEIMDACRRLLGRK